LKHWKNVCNKPALAQEDRGALRILYHHRTQAEDGQAVHIRSMIEALRHEGHEVREAALVPKADPETEAGPAPKVEAKRSRFSPWALMGLVPRFARELAEYGYTVPATGRLVREASAFQPDVIYERYAFGNLAGVRAAKRLKLPLILEVNSPMVLELGRTRGLSFPRMADRIERQVFCGADRVCVVTAVLGEMLVEMGVERERLLVTPNGVHLEHYNNLDREAARQDLGIADTSGPVLGFVGYYRDWHRLDLVIDGLAAGGDLAHAHLVLVGAGPVEDELREQAAKRGLADRLHFAGTRPHHGIPKVLPAFDVALVPAINPYASPLKLHEYMAAKLPTVAPDQPNLREVLTHGKDALLVPPGDGDALLEALGQLVRDSELRKRMGLAARATIEEQNLTWRGNALRVVSAAEALLERS
jgi:glycosyltransferase involved in cell wall biosynthesis